MCRQPAIWPPTTIANLPTTQKHFEWAAVGEQLLNLGHGKSHGILTGQKLTNPVNPLTPGSDQCLISPHSIKTAHSNKGYEKRGSDQ